MEPRLLLSAAAVPHAQVVAAAAARRAALVQARAAKAAAKVTAAAAASGSSEPIAVTMRADGTVPSASSPAVGQATPGVGYTPNKMRTAYGLGNYGSSSVTFGGVQADGRGTTIGIVDAGDDPYASTDINTFSSAFGLPLMNQTGGPTFTQLSQTGTTTLPAVYGTWNVEESLDIEWAHAIAPMANIILFETNTNSNANLEAGVKTAADHPGVVVVSMSYGGTEGSSSPSTDSIYTTPSGHTGVTFLASAGDGGTEVEFPAGSKNVVAVGGTDLTTTGSSGTYSSEAGWSGSGGGVSAYEAQPSYQAGTVGGYSTTYRTVPDVSIDADPGTGVPICDSYDYGTTTPWLGGDYEEGGTSLASPMWAGLIAIVDQGRVAAGLTSLDGATQTLPRLYQLSSSDFHDVTTINNGSAVVNGGVGYDLNTGRGTPISNKLIPDLAGDATITGQVFRDTNANDTLDGTDTAYAGQTVYLDLANTGTYSANDPTATTNTAGTYTFSDVVGGVTATVRLKTAIANVVQVAASSAKTAYTGTSSSVNLGEFPVAYADAAASDVWTLRASPASSTTLQVLVNGTVTYTAPVSLPTTLTFSLSGSADSMSVDFGNGVPVPSGGITVSGTSATNGDTLAVYGTAGNDTIAVNAATVVFGSSTINYSNMANLSVEPRTGTDSLAVNSGTVSMPAQTAGVGFLARSFSSLSVAAGAKLVVGTAAARTDRTVVVVTTPANLSVASTGQLDLGGNDMIVKGGTLSTVVALAKAGYANGNWTGTGGLASNAAAGDASHTTALGVIQASSAANTSTFDGQSITAADILVKYTYYGDANLDGVVNIADYTRTDLGFLTTGSSGWGNGDYDYDNVIDGSDYTLMDNAFNSQTITL